MSRAVALRQRAEDGLLRRAGRAVIVGGGAGGLEVALALERLARQLRPTGGAEPGVTIVEAAPRILSESLRAGAPRRRATARHARRPGARRRQATAVGPERRAARRRNGRAVRPDGVARGGGCAAAPRRVELAAGPPGYLLVDPTLRAVDGTAVFGAGDCIGIAGYPGLAKAGVYAVRESPCSTSTCAPRSPGARCVATARKRPFSP